ncbi:Protein O-glucosyltransferase 2 [Mactra antiquata]
MMYVTLYMHFQRSVLHSLILVSLLFAATFGSDYEIDGKKCLVWGPGLKTEVVLPVRYFYIQAVSISGENITQSIGHPGFSVSVTSTLTLHSNLNVDIVDSGQGLYIVRYRLFEALPDLEISVTFGGQHVAQSPYYLSGPVYDEHCSYPEPSPNTWLSVMNCPKSFKQIEENLSIFKTVDLENVAKEILKKNDDSSKHGLCHYKIINNEIYSKSYGEHVDFKDMFDDMLLSITRKVHLPDIELLVQLGDWTGHLEEKGHITDPLPVFGWSGHDHFHDITMPTYYLVNSTLNMLTGDNFDIFSIVGNSPTPWESKTEVGYFCGRDSSQDRLDLVMLARKYPEYIDARFNRMLAFEHDVDKYGDIVEHVPFLDFFKYKYQISIDGTVAPYRLPYLLAGDSVVLKQDSVYYEHFHLDLQPYVHYIPFKNDLSDLIEKIQWSRDNDEKAKEIGRNGRKYVLENLTPSDIYCYYVSLFLEYSKRLKSPPLLADDSWTHINQHKQPCRCNKRFSNKYGDEL